MKSLHRILGFCLLVAVFTLTARAEEVSRTSWWPHAEDFYVSDFTTYYGPNVNNLNSFTVNSQGETSKQHMYFDNEVTAAYLIDRPQVLGIGPSVRFNYSPIHGEGFAWNDVGLKFIDYRTFHTDNFHLSLNFYVLAPTAAWSKAAGMHYALKTTPSIMYDIPGTSLTLGAWTEAKDYVGVNYGTQFKLYYGPWLKWKVARNLALNLLYEEEYHHDKGMHGAGFKRTRADIEPGVIWQVNRSLSFNPYVAFYLDNKLTADRASLGATMNARIL